MGKLKVFAAVFFIVLVASCSFPDGSATKRMMAKYWGFYMSEQYDSLRRFYMPGKISDTQMTQLFTAMQGLREEYGIVRKVGARNISFSTSTSDGEKITMEYEVEYEKKVLTHNLIFRRLKDDEFRIVGHNWLMDHSFGQ